METEPTALSVARIQEARETLTEAFQLALRGFPGAIQCEDPAGVFCEAKRNLTALVQWLYGDETFLAVLKKDRP